MLMLITLAVFLLDQASKYLIAEKMSLGQSIPVVENIFHITYIQNPGAAFGLLANQTAFFIVVTAAVLAGIFVFHWKRGVRGQPMTAALGLIAGGSLGNLVDRVRYGGVVDFLDFRIWPVFNLADSSLVIGAGLLVVILWKMESKS